jgi:RNA polymerase sigma factor (sigma-70 family)
LGDAFEAAFSARCRHLHSEDCDDLTSLLVLDCFQRIHEQGRTLDEREFLRALDAVSHRLARSARHGTQAVGIEPIVEDPETPEDRASRNELSRVLHGFVAELSPLEAHVFNTYLLAEERSLRGLAKELGISTTHLHRLVSRLRKRMARLIE